MIQAVSNFKMVNSKVNATNYDAKKNVMSNMVTSSQVADSFIHSKKSNQIAFKGNLTKTGGNLLGDAGSKIGGIAKRVADEASEVIGGAVRKLTKKNELPVVEKPTFLYSQRDGNLMSYKYDALNKLKEMLTKGEITQTQYEKKVTEFTDYFNNATSLPDSISSSTINSAKPSFKGDDIGVDASGYDGSGVDGGDFDCDSGDLDPDSLLSLLSS